MNKFFDRLLSKRSEEEAHQARLLILAGGVFFLTGVVILVIQIILSLHPAFPKAPATDLITDVFVIIMGGLIFWCVWKDHTRSAMWLTFISIWMIASVQLYISGSPATDISGGLGLFLLVVLAYVYFQRATARILFALTAITFISFHLLWLGGYLPETFQRNPTSQALFSIFAWLAIASIIAIVISSTIKALREHRQHLEDMVEERTSELQDAQQQISETLAFNQSIISASSLGITAYGSSGDCVLANEAAAKIVGTKKHQILQQNYHRIATWKKSGLYKTAQKSFETGEETRKEVHLTSTFGKDIWIDCRFVPFKLRGETHLLMLTDDVSEKRTLQERLIRQERLAMLGELAGSIAHELRNPLGVISNAVYYLKSVKTKEDEDIKEYLEIIEEETQGATKIVSDLLDFTRGVEPNREKVKLSPVLTQILKRHPLPEQIQVETQLPEVCPSLSMGPGHLEQILTNLITNACQAMPEGGRLTIQASVESNQSMNADKQLRITVKDTGTGIPEENLDKIFEPLFTTRARGIGLGLAITKKLVKANRGKISVESEVGIGSCFTVYLPVWSELNP